jgi:hypothetical protein
MINLEDISLDVSTYQEIESRVGTHQGYNPGCVLHPHWQDSCRDDINRIKQTGKLEALNWLGDGFPNRTAVRQTRCDKAGFDFMFKPLDCIDVQSGMYQFYGISSLVANFATLGNINVIEVGGGYGRLAMFFLAHFGARCHYVNIDYVPTSLTFSPQVIRQAFPLLKVADTLDLSGMPDANYVSLPAWEVGRLAGGYDVGVNIHSFQEMQPITFQWYIDGLHKQLALDGVLYTVNNPHESTRSHAAYDYSHFNEVLHADYPFGADWVQIYGQPCLERGFKKK